MSQGSPVGSKRVMVRTPERPAAMASKEAATVVPSEVTAPQPVTTTRWDGSRSRAGICMTGLRAGTETIRRRRRRRVPSRPPRSRLGSGCPRRGTRRPCRRRRRRPCSRRRSSRPRPRSGCRRSGRWDVIPSTLFTSTSGVTRAGTSSAYMPASRPGLSPRWSFRSRAAPSVILLSLSMALPSPSASSTASRSSCVASWMPKVFSRRKLMSRKSIEVAPRSFMIEPPRSIVDSSRRSVAARAFLTSSSIRARVTYGLAIGSP